MLRLGNKERVCEFSSVVRLNQSDGERGMADELFQKVPCAVTRMLVIHLPVCPAAALVLCYEYISLQAIRAAMKRYEFHVDLHLLPRIIRRRIGFAAAFLSLLGRPLHSQHGTLEAPVAAGIAGSSGLLVGQQQIGTVLSAQSLYQVQFFLTLLSRTVVRPP